jgi:hypothetical protein
MIASVECRAISLADGIPDLYVTTTHLPEDVSGSDFLSRHVSATGFVAPIELLGRTLRNLPLDPLRESRLNVTKLDYDSIRFLLAPLLSPPPPMMLDSYRAKHAFPTIDELRDKLGSLVSIEKLEFVASQALSIGATTTTREFLFLDWAWNNLKAYEAPYSHAPDLGAIPLSKLIEAGTKSACLVPLVAGVHGAVQAQLAGNYAIAFECILAGGGVTLVALSSLWIADRILRGVRSSTSQGQLDDKDSIVDAELIRRKRQSDADMARADREGDIQHLQGDFEPEEALPERPVSDDNVHRKNRRG